jgi:hypothetical protein
MADKNMSSPHGGINNEISAPILINFLRPFIRHHQGDQMSFEQKKG